MPFVSGSKAGTSKLTYHPPRPIRRTISRNGYSSTLSNVHDYSRHRQSLMRVHVRISMTGKVFAYGQHATTFQPDCISTFRLLSSDLHRTNEHESPDSKLVFTSASGAKLTWTPNSQKFPCHLTSVFINQMVVFNTAQSRILWEIGRYLPDAWSPTHRQKWSPTELWVLLGNIRQYCLFFRRTFGKQQTSDLILLHKITYLLLFCLSALAGRWWQSTAYFLLQGSNWKIRNLPTVLQRASATEGRKGGFCLGMKQDVPPIKDSQQQRELFSSFFIMYYLDDGWASSSSVSVSFNIPT